MWHGELNDHHVTGGFYHPGDLRRYGNIVVITGQNWRLPNVFASINLGNGAQTVVFYDVHDPSRPKYVGRLSETIALSNKSWK